jgi:putative DNA primase/helicase
LTDDVEPTAGARDAGVRVGVENDGRTPEDQEEAPGPFNGERSVHNDDHGGAGRLVSPHDLCVERAFVAPASRVVVSQAQVARGQGLTLSAAHRNELEASGIDMAVIVERGYRTVQHCARNDLATLGMPARALASTEYFPVLLLPVFGASGERISSQFKPAKPLVIRGRSIKYLSPTGRANCLDVHPRNGPQIGMPSVPLWITEGLKKGDALTSRGRCVVTLSGVFSWRSKQGTLGDWEDVPLRAREVVLCFDADARTNMNVARAMVRLGRWCTSKGARVRYLIVPDQFNRTPTKGVDDYFAAGGTLDALEATATRTEPDLELTDDTFSDARLAETIADDVLEDRFLWCKALGWLGWDEQCWRNVTEETVGEAVRQYMLGRSTDAGTAGKRADYKGWLSVLNAGRLRAILGLAKGIVERAADAFDADPDLLNTPTGVVDLRSGQVQPHDPDFLIRKITRGAYRPGYTHPDWEQALTALPVETRAWFHVRVGQAITGHPAPDGLILILQGSGENGKSAVTTDSVVPAMGDFADVGGAPLLVSATNAHPTERADLCGKRFLIAEELTGGRVLNVTAIKQITDVAKIKARYMRRDNFSFFTSHSLFVTTNAIPIVTETDHGTWRRLALVTFPLTFRKPHEALTGTTDRRGDPDLKDRLKSGTGGQHDAIVTWCVEGARRNYRDGTPALPAAVEADTRTWRAKSDRILAFWDDVLIADESSILTTELLEAFNAWVKDNGHCEWSKELFHPRFKNHAETTRQGVVERKTTRLESVSRRAGVWPQPLPRQARVYMGVRFRTEDGSDENEANTR